MRIVPDGVGNTNCRSGAGANSKAENWQQNVEEQEIACVEDKENETLNHKKSWMYHAKRHELRTAVSRHSYVKPLRLNKATYEHTHLDVWCLVGARSLFIITLITARK